MRQRALQVVPNPWKMLQVLRLAVAPVQPGENAENFGRALGAKGCVKLRERCGIEALLAGPTGADITAEQRQFERFGNVDAHVLQQRGYVIGGGTDDRVLKVEHADARGIGAVS